MVLSFCPGCRRATFLHGRVRVFIRCTTIPFLTWPPSCFWCGIVFLFLFVQAVGEPPFFMAASAFFAIKDAVGSARKDHGEPAFFRLNSPASSERSVGLVPVCPKLSRCCRRGTGGLVFGFSRKLFVFLWCRSPMSMSWQCRHTCRDSFAEVRTSSSFRLWVVSLSALKLKPLVTGSETALFRSNGRYRCYLLHSSG